MARNTVALLLAFLPLLALASQHPPHLRHRRHFERVRQVQANELDGRALHPEQINVAHAGAHRVIKREVAKRGDSCKPRQLVSSAPAETTTSSSSSTSATTTATDDVVAAAMITSPTTSSSSVNAQDAWAHGTSSSTWTQSSSTDSWTPSPTAGASGLLSITDNADEPNGTEDWLNCGINGGGWTPPMVRVDQLIASDLDANAAFAPCASYIDKFNQYGGQYNVHPIMLASFAMQESTCNPWATGGNGEAGLMQIAPENCGGAPSGEGSQGCWDVDFNIQRGAKLFSDMINSNGGNVIAAIGSYNGWNLKMTYADATAEASEGDCSAQNNLDYVYQFTNGWMQNKLGSSIGSIFNLKDCGN
ncbi:MAG: hypothetical protein TREMPRED_003374 [Tremellales sp. Tagirdzhanova-0007]|nr:MAG: hypothetical protein TREMPRED_003374 [Tremellales sp. Tagirdzhanova-0007]